MDDTHAQGGGFGGRLGAHGSSLDLKIAFKVRVHAAENLDEGAFAGAILTRQHMDFPRPNLEVHLAQHGHRSEPLGHAGHANQGRTGGESVRHGAVLGCRRPK